ncbi:hypothetical protein ACCD06_19630 [Azospirillum sp. CT11-132]|uniref:hypothetical protein n=1 Tax=Azospirillum sp. CT11-132 TaxID=3396317 RepID=UPI0039A5E420
MESLKAGIRSSCRLDQEAVLDGSSPRGEDAIIMPTMVPAAFSGRVAGFMSEWWPPSNRNAGRLAIGTLAAFASETVAAFSRNLQPNASFILALVIKSANQPVS